MVFHLPFSLYYVNWVFLDPPTHVDKRTSNNAETYCNQEGRPAVKGGVGSCNPNKARSDERC